MKLKRIIINGKGSSPFVIANQLKGLPHQLRNEIAESIYLFLSSEKDISELNCKLNFEKIADIFDSSKSMLIAYDRLHRKLRNCVEFARWQCLPICKKCHIPFSFRRERNDKYHNLCDMCVDDILQEEVYSTDTPSEYLDYDPFERANNILESCNSKPLDLSEWGIQDDEDDEIWEVEHSDDPNHIPF